MMSDQSYLYQYPAFYSEVNHFRKDDIIYYRDRCKKSKDPILEIGCGSGRITWQLAKDSKECWGCDSSLEMINYSNELQTKCLIHPKFIHGSVWDIDFDIMFQNIILPFNVIMHCYGIKELIKLFSYVKRCLMPGGFLIFDLIRPNTEVGINYSEKILPLEDTGGIPINASCIWSSEENLASFHWNAFWRGNELNVRFRQFFFTSCEVKIALNKAGFAEIREYGYYDRSLPVPSSPLIVMEVRKTS
jgi:SAM-dependent methyltransferase